MTRTTVAIVLLSTALILSNALWAYHSLDAGVTATYQEMSLEQNRQALAQVIAVAKESSRPGHSRASIVAAARVPDVPSGALEKDGFLWIGQIGLRFDANDQLLDVRRSWDTL